MAESSDELLVSVISSLVSGGITRRTVWGTRMKSSVWRLDIPIERAASVWPRSIDSMPARTISAWKPPELRPSAITPDQYAGMLTPSTGRPK